MTNDEMQAMAGNIERLATKVEGALRGETTRDAVVALCMILGETIENDDGLATIVGCIQTRYEEMKAVRGAKK